MIEVNPCKDTDRYKSELRDFSREFTVSSPLTFSGIGVHSGKSTEITINPAEPGTGITFIKNEAIIPLNYEKISKSLLCTKVFSENEEIATVEHLLSALYGLGISNAVINVKGNEIPVMDGSAAVFAEKLSKVIEEQEKQREFITIRKPVSFCLNDKFIAAVPAEKLEIMYFLDYGNRLPGFMYEKFIYSPAAYLKDISPARTFGFLEEAEYLHSKGLALGAGYDNTLVIGKEGFSQPLRFSNEPAKHKVLDLLGDLAVLGKFLKAKIVAYKTGHSEHLELVKRLSYQD